MAADIPDAAHVTSMRLDARWLHAPATQTACRVLTAGGRRALFVGGIVRNTLLDAPASDIDIATDAEPREVMGLAAAAGVRAVPTGIDHGTVTLVIDGEGFEVTSFRRDVATDGRRAVVAFSRDIRDDAARRDLTMNALYADPRGVVIDPLGALPDVKARRVRFVGSAAARIEEDALRILRFFRFSAAYGDPDTPLDTEGVCAAAQHRDRIGGLARERVGTEMSKILGLERPFEALLAMAATGVLEKCLPGTDLRDLPALMRIEGRTGTRPEWRRRASALGLVDGSAQDLRLSRQDARHLALLAAARAAAEDGVAPAVLGYRYGPEIAEAAVLVAGAHRRKDPEASFRAEAARGAGARMPVSAAMLPHLQGAAIGAELRRLEAEWIASDFALDAEALLSGRVRDAPNPGNAASSAMSRAVPPNAVAGRASRPRQEER